MKILGTLLSLLSIVFYFYKCAPRPIVINGGLLWDTCVTGDGLKGGPIVSGVKCLPQHWWRRSEPGHLWSRVIVNIGHLDVWTHSNINYEPQVKIRCISTTIRKDNGLSQPRVDTMVPPAMPLAENCADRCCCIRFCNHFCVTFINLLIFFTGTYVSHFYIYFIY